LLNLRTISSLYDEPDDQYLDPDEDASDPDSSRPHPPAVSVYPQAFLRDFGHIQSKGIMHLFTQAVHRINLAFHPHPNDDLVLDDPTSDDPSPYPLGGPVLTAISSQGYNELSHRAAPRAGAHDVQQGYITTALSGGFASSRKAKEKASQKRSYCDIKLPHDRFRHKIMLEDCPRTMRMEHVYCVNMQRLPVPKRNGRYVLNQPPLLHVPLTPSSSRFIARTLFKDIVCKLAQAWSSPEVFERLREHLLILKPEVRLPSTPFFLPTSLLPSRYSLTFIFGPPMASAPL
jgi:hypothetical protein